MPQRHRLLTVSILILLLFYIHLAYLNPSRLPHLDPILPANSTLNFGAIIAVSHSRSPRRASLLWAANLTDLSIVIPPQPEWTNADIEEFRSAEGSAISIGSARAWLGHLNALQWFLDTGYQTALIVEDDVDFGIGVRARQVPLFAAGLRSLFNVSSDSPHEFWGPLESWDILYPGHCDDLPSPLYSSHPSVLYTDVSTPNSQSNHPATQHFMRYLNIPPHSRLLHRAFFFPSVPSRTQLPAHRPRGSYSTSAERKKAESAPLTSSYSRHVEMGGGAGAWCRRYFTMGLLRARFRGRMEMMLG